MSRKDGRLDQQKREITIIPNVNPYAEGSCEVNFGKTKVLVAVSVEAKVPRWMEDDSKGWITAEYGMLPRSTHTRSSREAARGKQGGRTLEIQRLIGRSLRQAIKLEDIKGLTIQVDCDVIVADGGTRTAAITGAWVAVVKALNNLKERGLVDAAVKPKQLAAISLGISEGSILTDLCYEEDVACEVDLNLVMTDEEKIVEIQGTAEEAPFSLSELNQICEQGKQAILEIFEIQREALSCNN